MRMVFKVMEQDDITWRKLAGQKKEKKEPRLSSGALQP